MSDENEHEDYVGADIGENGKDIVVGKNIDTRRKRTDQRNDQRVEVNLPDLADRQPRIVDIYNVLADDPLRGTPGLVSKVNQMDRRLIAVEENMGVMKMQLISIEDLVVSRNENRGKIHLTPLQALFIVGFIILIVVVFAPWFQAHLPKGPINGSVGLGLLLCRHC